ncbi:RNA pseudouridine synthase 5 isoform X2 [Capsicum annuum]|uniref:RNA pseudouridine synthase 5 isoform X2 n=2 Tax=Capsicum annuum TaxID=4072 RepID=UPI001FB1849B|nr:RNA pseudouridine synthase 5 isoform X2 [Capsicum annuum]
MWMRRKTEVGSQASEAYFGVAWPEVNDGLTYHDIVRPTDSGLTLIEFYFSKYKNSAPLQGEFKINRSQLMVKLLRYQILNSGAKLVYHRLPWREPDAPYLLQVLFEDDYLIAVNKPSGLQVLPGGLYQQRTVLTQLQWHACKLTATSSGCQKTHPVPVHRLGRGTSGILLCAKTKLGKSRLAAYFAEGTAVVGDKHTNSECNTMRKICKIYRALVSGVMDMDEVVIKQPIGTIKYSGVAKGLYVASPSGKPALSSVRVLERDSENNCTLVQVEIQSGRPHQIRIHLSFIGLPLIGDPLYVSGGQPKCFHPVMSESFEKDGGYRRPENPVPGDSGYNLHAHQIVLIHPIINEFNIPESEEYFTEMLVLMEQCCYSVNSYQNHSTSSSYPSNTRRTQGEPAKLQLEVHLVPLLVPLAW